MLDESTSQQSQTSYKSTPSTRSSVLERAQKLRKQKQQSAAYNMESPSSAMPPATPAGTVSTQSTRRRGEDGQAAPEQQQQQEQQPIVSPEILVDALSGHEDGLLAIAERLMEHYDQGYDAMGEAIIDAFADVQKLFQHVVEAAHMEGAAFEASRREEELTTLRQQLANQTSNDDGAPAAPANDPKSPNGPVRHDEFIDQDVKDCLNEAIQKGAALKEANQHGQCFELYEQACQSASALLPVDSDHRGRLQLSIARAESMSPDRACAILRYAMDDVLRSGLRAGNVPLPDLSQRADVVLEKPSGSVMSVQSSEEHLNSLVEEMKEIMEAPVYKDTPLQVVSKRFWGALQEAQKHKNKKEDRLEQNLAKLKGDFLLARAEWEEKLSQANAEKSKFEQKYVALQSSSGAALLEEARNVSQQMGRGTNDESMSSSLPSFPARSNARGAESIASFSSMAQHARTLVNQFNCASLNDHVGPVMEGREESQQRSAMPEWRERDAAKKAFISGNRGTRVVDV